MAKVISIHSFRRGTGKSSLTANIATLLAGEGRRVGVIDTNLQSPSLHVLFGLDETKVIYSLNDYLAGKCNISQTARDVTRHLRPAPRGQILLIPASSHLDDITQALRGSYHVSLLSQSFDELVQALALDVLVIDTHAGLNEETLLSVAASDTLITILRPDQQDYQGTGIIIEVARKLKVPSLLLIVNEVPLIFGFASLKAQLEQTYNCRVAAILPHVDEIMALASADIFVLRYPDHPITTALKQIAVELMV